MLSVAAPNPADYALAMRSVLVGMTMLVALGACNRSRAPATPTAPEWMETELIEQVQRRAPDAVAVSPVFAAVAYDEDEFTRWDVTLQQGYCYYFSGVGDPNVDELQLALFDAEDDEVAEDERDDPARVVIEYCPEVSGPYQLMAKVTDGAGHYLAGVFGVAKDGAPPPQASTASPPPPAPAPAGDDLEGRIEKLAGASAPDADRVGDYFQGSSAKTDWYVALEQGKCYWFIAAGEPSIEKLSLYLWDPNDKRQEHNPSETNEVTIGYCPTIGGMHHFQAKVEGGEGAYMVGVYVKVK